MLRQASPYSVLVGIRYVIYGVLLWHRSRPARQSLTSSLLIATGALSTLGRRYRVVGRYFPAS